MLQHETCKLSDLGPPRPVEPRPSGDSDREALQDREQQDRHLLAKLGKKSVLKRNFQFLSILGFSCAILVTWEGTLMSFAPGLQNGGPAGLIYGFIFVWIGNLSVFSTLCELVSIAPTSGGQYHWVAMLAPRSCSRFLSYLTGWLNLAGWQGTLASAGYLTGTMLQGLIVFTSSSSYVPRPWEGTLMLWLCVLVAVLINTVISSMLPKIECGILVLHIVGFFAVLIALTIFGKHGDVSHIFYEFRNTGEWATQGLSCFVGIIGVVFAFAGVDCSFHMCEEVKNPSVAVPRSIMTSIAINGVMGLAMIIAMLCSATNIDEAIESSTGYPYIEIFFQATGSRAATAAMTSLIIVMTLFAIVGVTASTSRMLWAFARDRALPFWPVDARTNVPVWAICTTSLLACLLGLINLGSTVVYNALVSVAISGLYSSYLISASLLLYRRCGKGIKNPDPRIHSVLTCIDGESGLAWGPWHLPGVYGIANNTFACIFMIIIWFFSFWPPAKPTSAATMNLSVVMTGSVVIFSAVYYLRFS
ncbi:amino acid/polyamine transporter I [Ophiocordyceps sinensis CO18]|uniref:Amino acid/polyamine transporter I n=1 Tax=Ophiocordyceps sinensis (strain Co18 / CGMCC 3.14243) TaxID=911162 RepID=T5A2N3_OPHSC|nr:amino acid/polyamine transporter I [Ophiocordyceps sinensis CO18]